MNKSPLSPKTLPHNLIASRPDSYYYCLFFPFLLTNKILLISYFPPFLVFICSSFLYVYHILMFSNVCHLFAFRWRIYIDTVSIFTSNIRFMILTAKLWGHKIKRSHSEFFIEQIREGTMILWYVIAPIWLQIKPIKSINIDKKSIHAFFSEQRSCPILE